jgi:hypothetical protein
MKKELCFIALMLVTFLSYGQDLKSDVNQTTFDKVVASMKIPFTLFEHKDPFQKEILTPEENIILEEGLATKGLPPEKSLKMFQWAVEDNTKANDVDQVFKSALLEEWERVKSEIHTLVEEHQKVVSKQVPGIDQKEFNYQEYSIEELTKLQQAPVDETIKFFEAKEKGAFSLKAHLAYFRVDLNERPSLKISSPAFTINNIRVEPTVRGELWAKVPEFRCCRRVFGICVCVRVSWEWKRIASVTISPNIGADATIIFSETNLKINAKAKFNKLFLDYAIIREINLASIANHYLNAKKFEVYDASKFIASLPYINSNFRIESLVLPPAADGLSVQINIKQ